ncbi:MAG: hypothetical protein KBT11_09330 [Treponema sp.]|nr:hypothetical protein [Candidatus Treponema equifaecale]
MKKIFCTAIFIFFSFFSVFSQEFNQARPLAKAISAKKAGINKISLSWTLPKEFNAASIAVFRDTKQISTVTSILSLKPVAELPAKTTKYTDVLERYGEYFYALIPRDRNGTLIKS